MIHLKSIYDVYGRREVFIEEGQKFAEANGIIFLETSAKTGINIDEVIHNYNIIGFLINS